MPKVYTYPMSGADFLILYNRDSDQSMDIANAIRAKLSDTKFNAHYEDGGTVFGSSASLSVNIHNSPLVIITFSAKKEVTDLFAKLKD